MPESLQPLYPSTAAWAAVVADAVDRDATFQRKTAEILRSTQQLDIDSESIRCAAEIAGELAHEGRRLDGVDLFVAAGARLHGQVLVSSNPGFEGVVGVVCERY